MQDCFPIHIDDAEFLPLELVRNSHNSRKVVQIIDPEFSSVCPKTGLPDYGRVILRYVPDESLVELKSWKLYLRCWYGVGCYHEETTQRIADNFTRIVKPRWMNIVIDWGARGGLHTTTQLTWSRGKGYVSYPDHWEDPTFVKHAEGWNNR